MSQRMFKWTSEKNSEDNKEIQLDREGKKVVTKLEYPHKINGTVKHHKILLLMSLGNISNLSKCIPKVLVHIG